MTIENIVFDLDNVLVYVDKRKAYQRIGRFMSRESAELAARDPQAFDSLFDGPVEALETGRIDFEEFYREIARICGLSLSANEFLDMFRDMFHMNDAMVSLGERLASGYDTWLASNTSREHYDWIMDRFPRVAFVKAAALSYRMGVVKPSRLFYEKMIADFGIDPGRSVFVDDLRENVDGAVACGLKGIVFRDVNQFVEELERLGVSIPKSGE